MSEERIKEIERKLDGRTTRDGKPKKGYEQNVEACKRELARLRGES